MKIKIPVLLMLFLATFLLTGFVRTQNENIPAEGAAIEATDYSLDSNWITIPEPVKPADIFVLYPTTYRPAADEPVIAPIDHEGMRAGAREFVETKASAFETAGNVYAPYYRQLDASWLLSQSLQDQMLYTNGVPATDVIAAFDYYIKNYNQGRPFILVSHSQGSATVKTILFDYLKSNPEVNERLIAAYVIGYSVTRQELEENPHLKFAQGADDTGVIISYNTVSADFEGELTTSLPEAVTINPISWTQEEITAEAGENAGSFINTGEGYEAVSGLADATVDAERGLIICSTADPDLYGMPEALRKIFPKGSFHTNDISFYYFNLRENAENRVMKYFESHPD